MLVELVVLVELDGLTEVCVLGAVAEEPDRTE
jgi:hypothetical protein